MPSRWKFKSRAPPRGRRPRVAGSGVWAPLLYAHRMVLSPRAGYRITKKTGRAVNRTIKQTKTAISILLSQCLATDRGFRRRGLLTFDTRAGGPRFIRACGWSKVAALAGGGKCGQNVATAGLIAHSFGLKTLLPARISLVVWCPRWDSNSLDLSVTVGRLWARRGHDKENHDSGRW